MSSSVNVDAVEAAVRAAAPGIAPAYLPLVELTKTLARQVDDSGAEGPSARLAAAYLSALRSFGKVAVAAPADATKPRDPLKEFQATYLHRVPTPAGVAS